MKYEMAEVYMAIRNNAKRMSAIARQTDRIRRYEKARNIVMGAAREANVKLTDEDISEVVYDLIRKAG